jgi:hypothetical protein
MQAENKQFRTALEQIASIMPPDESCGQKADEVYGINDGKQRGIMLKCALDIARAVLKGLEE